MTLGPPMPHRAIPRRVWTGEPAPWPEWLVDAGAAALALGFLVLLGGAA